MTNLKIGTILIAKEDFGEFTKCKEYPIVENNNDITYRVICNDEKSVNWFDERRINQYFTIKRYALSDLQEKKIAVKLRDYEEYKRLCEIIGDTPTGKQYFNKLWDYFGVDNILGGFGYLQKQELEGRILLDSIDEINLGDEGKEDSTIDYRKPIAMKAGDKRVLVNGLVLPVDFRIISEDNYKLLKSEIARLKGELDSANEACKILLNEANSPDLTKRERMAWELYMKYEHMEIDRSFDLVDTFLAKSKEVKP